MIYSRMSLACFMFLAVVACAVRPGVAQEDSPERRESRLKNMTDAEKQSLLQKKKLFDQLTRDEKEQLRDFHEELVTHPDYDRLRVTLERYNQWLRTLPPGERAQLISLPADQRLARIREIMRRQETQRFRMLVDGSLSKEDKHVIQQWLDDFIEANESKCLAAIDDERFRTKISELDSEKRKLILSGAIWRPGNSMPRPSAEDRDELSKSLSREARALLAKAPGDEERDQILDNWIRAATFSRMWRQPSSEELEQFAKKLTEEQREFLESLPREKMFEELRKMYYRNRFPDRVRGPGFRRPGRGPGGGPGPGSGPSGGPGGEHRRRGGKGQRENAGS